MDQIAKITKLYSCDDLSCAYPIFLKGSILFHSDIECEVLELIYLSDFMTKKKKKKS